ncbi:MAG: type II toxin-antitoxin system VapC family toxin [Candidatus Hinthialibacter antarcticus]|nr:type II toxin-antitoxin system VapC family toxin [Candidatus Hinthialibacter antarcticus]
MVKLLLDTQVYLWWLMDDPQLSDQAKAEIRKSHNVVFISAATIWEISINRKTGKIKIPDSYSDIEAEQFLPLPVTSEHAVAAGAISGMDNAQFERMLVAQAQCENLTLVSHNTKLAKFKINTIPA